MSKRTDPPDTIEPTSPKRGKRYSKTSTTVRVEIEQYLPPDVAWCIIELLDDLEDGCSACYGVRRKHPTRPCENCPLRFHKQCTNDKYQTLCQDCVNTLETCDVCQDLCLDEQVVRCRCCQACFHHECKKFYQSYRGGRVCADCYTAYYAQCMNCNDRNCEGCPSFFTGEIY